VNRGHRILAWRYAATLAGAAIIAAGCGSSGSSSATVFYRPSSGASASAVTINGSHFLPAVLDVKTGTTVTWTNEDSDAHTVTFVELRSPCPLPGSCGSPSSGKLGRGATYRQTFNAPGTFPYVCALHQSMTGSVVVAP